MDNGRKLLKYFKSHGEIETTLNEEDISMNDEGKKVEWDGNLTVSLTLGEFMEITNNNGKVAMAIDLLKGRNDIPEPIIEAFDEFVESIDSHILDHGNDSLMEIFDED